MKPTDVDIVGYRVLHLFKLIKVGMSVLLIGAILIAVSMWGLKQSEEAALQNAQSAIYNAEVQATSILGSKSCTADPDRAICLQAGEIIKNPTTPVELTETQAKNSALVASGAIEESTVSTILKPYSSSDVCVLSASDYTPTIDKE